MNGRKILVVDDNVDSAQMMTMLLNLTGHEAQTAYDGESAITTAQSFRPEFVFLDIGLPRMDGYEVARRMRQLPNFERVVLVAMTGFSDEEDRRRASAAGFNDYLVKPAETEAIERILRKSPAT